MLIKNYKILNLNLFLGFIHKKKYLNFNNLSYLYIPKNIGVFINAGSLTIICLHKLLQQDFLSFNLLLSSWLKRLKTPYSKKLILKGLGIRAALLNNSSLLELKLGFSHLIYIKIPSKVLFVKIFKNVISVSGCNSVFVANFLYKIRVLKLPNSYKGKGLWYKNEQRKLKPVKKV
jgi:large subunit ribosomal protein L6